MHDGNCAMRIRLRRSLGLLTYAFFGMVSPTAQHCSLTCLSTKRLAPNKNEISNRSSKSDHCLFSMLQIVASARLCYATSHSREQMLLLGYWVSYMPDLPLPCSLDRQMPRTRVNGTSLTLPKQSAHRFARCASSFASHRVP